MQTITRISQVREFTERLKAGKRLGQTQIAEVMNHLYGSSANGSWSWKSATDAIEAAMVSYLLQQPKLSLFELRSLQDLTVDHRVRTQEQIDLQQFSSPLELAWLVAKAAMVTASDILLEPSAGTGLLVGTSINQNTKPAHIILNEFSKSRRDLLADIFPPAERYSVNAEYLNDMLLQRIKPSVIMMNPPFSRSLTSTKRNPDVCLKHLRSALLRLLPNGRLVAIVAHWLSPAKHPDYFATLPAKLRLSVYLDGSFYRHHGTTMPTRLLVFDKVEDETEPHKSIDYPMSIEEIGEIIDLIVPQRLPMLEAVEPAADAPLLALPLFASVHTNPFGTLPLFQLLGGNAVTTTEAQIVIKPVQPVATVTVIPKTQFGEIVELQYQQVGERNSVFTDGVYQPYQPSAIDIPGSAPHPTALAESVSMAAVTSTYPTCTVKLPARILQEGLASQAQLEALIYATAAHSQLLDTKWRISEHKSVVFANGDDVDGRYHRQGYFIGDSTGVGKGVEAALIILSNWCEGRKRAIWISKNEPLIEDARRDWVRLGGNAEQVVALSKFKLGEPIKLTEGILFVTFGGLRTGAKGTKKSRVEQIIDWVGEDFDGAICVDEAHLMGNCSGETTERGQTKASAQALAGTHLIDRLADARVTYLSATGASKVSNLAYCQRLGLWMTNQFPFTSRDQFISKMDNAGVAGLEVLAQDLKRTGKYIARTLSFEGVSFQTLTHALTRDQQQNWDVYARAFQVIHGDLDKALVASGIEDREGKCLNSRAKCNIYSQFESLKQRFFNSLLCAAKAPTLIAAIEADLAAGKACVIQLVSTNEAMLDRKLAQTPTGEWGDLRAIDFTSREIIADYMINSFPVYLYTEYVDDNGNNRSEIVKDAATGEPVVCQEALEMRDRLIEDLSLLPPITGLLDQLNWHFGHENVAEITGRSKRIILKDDRYQLVTRSGSASIAETEAFQGDRKQILIFSSAGGTGRSYHADLNCHNQRVRRHYLVESGFQAIVAVQGFGRTHRSNQAHPPEVVLVTTNVKGEYRFTATIASRLGQLGAISKGQRDTANNGLFDEEVNNFSSQYAKVALGEFFADLNAGKIEGISISEFEQRTGLKLTGESGAIALGNLPKITTFLNRLLALPIDIQNLVFSEFEQRIQQRIAQAKAAGIYDRGLETLYSDNGFEIIESKVIATQNHSETICHSIDKLSKPRILPAIAAKQLVLEGYRYYRHTKTQTVAIAAVADARTTRTGKVVDTVYVRYPVGNREYERVDLPDFEVRWAQVEPDEFFWQTWNHVISQTPAFVKERIYLICGLLLPVWDKLPVESPKVCRLQANDGRVLLGRAIEAKDIGGVLAKFGVDSCETLDAETIFQLVWEGESSYTIGSKWKLQRNYFKGEDRLEILEVYARSDLDWLRSIGCFSEMLNCRMRVFIPVNRASITIDSLLQ
jgi:P-loop containing NTP hydrolase pore-1/C-terminal domain on Strawberry notch homologue